MVVPSVRAPWLAGVLVATTLISVSALTADTLSHFQQQQARLGSLYPGTVLGWPSPCIVSTLDAC